jgi:hypothetical protein
VRIPLAKLRENPPVEPFPVEYLSDDTPLGGQRVDLDHGQGTAALEVHTDARGRHASLVLHDARDGRYPPIYSSALARTDIPLWVYPLLPVAAAIDAVTNPLLLLLAPAVIVPGD